MKYVKNVLLKVKNKGPFKDSLNMKNQNLNTKYMNKWNLIFLQISLNFMGKDKNIMMLLKYISDIVLEEKKISQYIRI